MIDEGVIKFNCNWNNFRLPEFDFSELLNVRNRLFQLKLIGYDETEKVGYGNISVRLESGNEFVISGTQTGHIAVLSETGLSHVYKADIQQNSVECSGPAKASSESLTHYSIYLHVTYANAVIHVHHEALWNSLLQKAPTTRKEIPYGTIEMANEIKRLITEEQLLDQKILAMAGHKDGVITFGKDLDEAMSVLLNYFQRLPA
jgi:ribulose-5-phosphate 4-epimerase/fuculose-1-phosphate aldolase